MSNLHNLSIEQAVLCALMTYQNAWERVDGKICEVCFYPYRHRLIFAAIADLAHSGKAYDPLAVEQQLKASGKLAGAGGSEYLIEMMGQAAASAAHNIEHHCAELNRLKDHRAVEEMGQKIQQIAQDLELPDVYSAAESALSLTTDKQDAKTTYFDAEDAADVTMTQYMEKVKRAESPQKDSFGLKFGMKQLDAVLGNIEPADYCVIAGREGSGKSTLAQQFVITNCHVYRKAGLFICADMPMQTLVNRLWSALGDIEYSHLRNGTFDQHTMQMLPKACASYKEWRLIIDDKQQPTVNHIRSAIRKAKRTYPDLSFLVVDYIGLVREPRYGQDRRLEVNEVSAQMKAIGKEFGLSVLVLAQLNRENVKTGRKPRNSDLKESGNIEADADQIIFVHPDVNAEGEPLGTSSLVIGKNRHGTKPEIKVLNQLNKCKFAEIADYVEESMPPQQPAAGKVTRRYG